MCRRRYGLVGRDFACAESHQTGLRTCIINFMKYRRGYIAEEVVTILNDDSRLSIGLDHSLKFR